MPIGHDIFKVTRVNKLMNNIQDVRELPQELKFLNRTAIVPALDEEIMARYTGRVLISDIVSDDVQANIYQSGKFAFESTAIPNIKHGVGMPQSQLNQLNQIAAEDFEDPQGIFRSWERRTLDSLLLGNRQRMEALIVAMLLDSFVYDRLGLKVTAGWGCPADLKVTPANAWSDATNGKPIDDILTLREVARVRYGQNFNRMTLGLTAFRYLIQTNQFKDYVRQIYATSFPTAPQIPLMDTMMMVKLAAPILGLDEIEIYDARAWTQNADATITSAPFLPINKVILTNTSDDNNEACYDFANGVVTESLVSTLVPSGMIGQFAGATRGPVSYVTPANANLNPPGVTYWAVTRGFPRRHLLQCSANLTVGSFTDLIPVGEPY